MVDQVNASTSAAIRRARRAGAYLGKNILQLQYIAISPPKYTLQCIELLQYILLRIKILQYILDRLETIAIYIGALFITVPCFNHIILALNR